MTIAKTQNPYELRKCSLILSVFLTLKVEKMLHFCKDLEVVSTVATVWDLHYRRGRQWSQGYRIHPEHVLCRRGGRGKIKFTPAQSPPLHGNPKAPEMNTLSYTHLCSNFKTDSFFWGVSESLTSFYLGCMDPSDTSYVSCFCTISPSHSHLPVMQVVSSGLSRCSDH